MLVERKCKRIKYSVVYMTAFERSRKMSDSMIRVGRRGSNFIDANLLVFPKKKYPKIKRVLEKK